MAYKVVILDQVKRFYYALTEIQDVFTYCYGIFPASLYHRTIKTFEEGLNLICDTMNWKLVSITLDGSERVEGQKGMAIFETSNKKGKKESI